MRWRSRVSPSSWSSGSRRARHAAIRRDRRRLSRPRIQRVLLISGGNVTYGRSLRTIGCISTAVEMQRRLHNPERRTLHDRVRRGWSCKVGGSLSAANLGCRLCLWGPTRLLGSDGVQLSRRTGISCSTAWSPVRWTRRAGCPSASPTASMSEPSRHTRATWSSAA